MKCMCPRPQLCVFAEKQVIFIGLGTSGIYVDKDNDGNGTLKRSRKNLFTGTRKS